MNPTFVNFIAQIHPVLQGLIVFLVGFFLYRSLKMLTQSQSLRGAFRRLEHLLSTGGELPDLGRGLTLDALERIRAESRGAGTVVQDWWNRLQHHLQPYPAHASPREYFLARPVRDILPEIELLEGPYHAGAFHAVPGILTSLGLAGTFLAILQGLYHVHYNPDDVTRPVQGIADLINSLSGKFSSSLVALFLAVLFMLMEKHFDKKNRDGYEQLVRTAESALPLLTPVRVLVDLQASALKQETALRGISSEMVDGFKAAFTAEINPALSEQLSLNLMQELQPTLTRMAQTLSELNQAIRQMEASKHESLLQELTVVIKAMHESILEGLKGMGHEFHQAMAGAAQTELDGMQRTLEISRQSMDELCIRLETIGSRMVESMGTIQVTAEHEVQQAREEIGVFIRTMQENLNGVTADTQSRVQSLLAALDQGSRNLTEAARQIGYANESLRASLETHVGSLNEFKEVGKSMKLVGASFREMTQQAEEMFRMQTEDIHRIEGLMETLTERQITDGQLLEEYQSAFLATQGRLVSLDKDLAKAFATIHQGMETWVKSVESCLTALTSETNQHTSTISTALSRQLEDLGEKLEDFSESLDRLAQKVKP